MQPSKYQQAIFDWVSNGQGSAIVQAVAGSGKTTTVVKALELIPPGQSILLLAFNKSIAEELMARVPSHVTVKTFNGLGHSALGRQIGARLNLDGRKIRKIAKEQMGAWDYSEFGNEVVDLVGFARRYGVLPAGVRGVPIMMDEPETWEFLIGHFGIPVKRDTRQLAIDFARSVIRESIDAVADERHMIDFDDQIYIPAIKQFAMDQYDWVFVDEAQDVSPVRTKLVSLVLKEGGRLCAVGDKFQAIYGFTGSDAKAIETLRELFNAQEFPLSISYRCSKKVVARAKSMMPTIEASETAPEGDVLDLGQNWTLADIKPGDMVLCRKNAPIVGLAWKLLSAGKACRILGRDIAGGIVKLIEDLKPKGLKGDHGLDAKIGQWLNTEILKWTKEEREDMIDAACDKADCVRAIMARSSVNTVPDLIRSIEAMFSDDTGAGKHLITLCSMHKSKGLEAERVIILDWDLLPLPHAKKKWQLEQENNLGYVAVTRAKHTLTFIDSQDKAERAEKKEAA